MNYFALMITIFLLPLVMVICGMSYTKRGPKKITRLQGYRSKMSMKNRETWDFAHKNLAVTSVVSLLVFRESTKQITTWCCVIFVIQLVIMVLPVVYTEKALKENFDENGKWKKGAKEKWQEREQKLKKDYQQE